MTDEKRLGFLQHKCQRCRLIVETRTKDFKKTVTAISRGEEKAIHKSCPGMVILHDCKDGGRGCCVFIGAKPARIEVPIENVPEAKIQTVLQGWIAHGANPKDDSLWTDRLKNSIRKRILELGFDQVCRCIERHMQSVQQDRRRFAGNFFGRENYISGYTDENFKEARLKVEAKEPEQPLRQNKIHRAEEPTQ